MPVVTSYDVTVVNLTSAQPMSPVTAVLHNEGTLWTLGESASDAIENLAESGSNEQLLALDVVMASGAGEGILMPGATQTFTVSGEDITAGLFSLATMLVNTNDAFTGINAMDVSSLSVGESISRVTSSYDSGTEANSETAATIPGPAGGGEGFNAARDDVDFVSMHSGVVTMDDGLMNSALSFHHRFDNPDLTRHGDAHRVTLLGQA